MRRKTRLAIAFVLTTLAAEARAGGSLFVDDATVTPSGRCQVETWARAYTPGQELTAVPGMHSRRH